MHGVGSIDKGKTIDWGLTSEDYARHRPGPPESFYQKLRQLQVGYEGQKILDLATGTGVLARAFAKLGAEVFGTDISEQQVEIARSLAASENLSVEFSVAPAESQPFEAQQFDVITANQCWLYFDKQKTIAEVKRLLRPGGVLVTSHFSWLPRKDALAFETEALILKHNPAWSAADYSGEVPMVPSWSREDFDLKGSFVYDEPIPFTEESWRGRIRASRGVGATLNPQEVEKFDKELKEMLDNKGLSEFNILHRLDAHVFQPK